MAGKWSDVTNHPMPLLLAGLGLLLIAAEARAERTLASVHGLTAVTAAEKICVDDLRVIVRAQDRAVFDGEQPALKRLMAGVRTMLEFECPNATAPPGLMVDGEVDGAQVYRGVATREGIFKLVEAPAQSPPRPKRKTDNPLARNLNAEWIEDYFRKAKNLPSTTKVKVILDDVRQSPIQGAVEGKLMTVSGSSVRELVFTASPDGRYVIFDRLGDTQAKPRLDNTACRGPANAKVTIVEYANFQCKFSQRAFYTLERRHKEGDREYPGVLQKYGKEVRFCMKNLPFPSFHVWSEPAAVAAECVREQKAAAYWKVYEGFFDYQEDLTAENVRAKAIEYAAGSIDKVKFADCYDNMKTAALVRADAAEAASLGITGTPTFEINGRRIGGSVPFERFDKVISEELSVK
jgi:protein-disulfide isomerase